MLSAMDDIDNESFGATLHQVNSTARNHYRDLEKLQKKLVQQKYSGTFNRICIDEKLLPNYTNDNTLATLSNPVFFILIFFHCTSEFLFL